jgi:hypothetical protein
MREGSERKTDACRRKYRCISGRIPWGVHDSRERTYYSALPNAMDADQWVNASKDILIDEG